MSASDDATARDNAAIARRIPEEVATEGNLDLLDELLSADAVDHGLFGQDFHGPEGVKEQLRTVLSAFPDLEATVEDVVAEGDLVAMRVTVRGTHEGEFMGIEPTGNSFEGQNMVFTRVEDGKITERWLQPDMLGMLQQLGVESIPAAPAEP